MFWHLLLTASSFILAQLHEPTEFVTELTSDSFSKSVESGAPLLVMYYAPWCGHCQRTMPQYELACEYINKSDAEQFVCSRLDCTKNEQFCRDQGLQGYPTIKLVHNNIVCEYKGPRTDDAISKWALSIYFSSSDEKDEVAVQKRISEGHSLVAFVEESHPMRDVIKSMRCDLSSINFTIISDAEVAKKVGIQVLNSINLFTNGSFVKSLSNAENVESIMKEIFFLTNPLIPEYTHETLHLVFSSHVKSYVAFVFDTQETLDKHVTVLEKFAESQVPEVRVFIINASNPSYKDVIDYFHVTSTPQIVYYNDTTQKFHHFTNDEISHEALVGFTSGCKEGSVPMYVQRQPIPQGWDEGDVKVLVTDTYDKIFETFKSGMILFYAPWCGHCEAFMPTWEKFGALVSYKYPGLFVGKLDHTVNDISDVQVQGYPTIVAYKSRTEQIPYTGDRTIESLEKFIESNLISQPISAEETVPESKEVKEDL